jgi:outer membrane protein, adhesin transport system
MMTAGPANSPLKFISLQSARLEPPPRYGWTAVLTETKQLTKSATTAFASRNQQGLDQTVERALRYHPDIGRAVAEIERSGGDVTMAQSALYPKLGYTSSLGSATDAASVSAGLEVNQLVHDFGRADNQILAAKAIREQRRAELRDTQERVALAASEAHLELARSQNLLVVTDRYLTALVNLRATIAIRADSGAANQADVYLADTRVQSAKAERIRSQTRNISARAELLQLTGSAVARVDDPAGEIGRINAVIRLTTLTSGTGIAAAESAAAAARARLKIAQVSLYPSIGLNAGYTQPIGDDSIEASSTIGLRVKGDLLTGGASDGQIRTAAAELQAAERSTALTRLTNATEVAVASAEIAGARDRSAAYARQLDSARKARETALAEYTIGKRTLTEVLNAEQEIFRAESERINADGDGRLAVVRAAAAQEMLVQSLGLDTLGPQ